MKKYKCQQSNCKSSPISNKLLQGLVSHKLTAYLSVFNLILTQWNMAILSKGCKPENFNPHNSLKLSFTNIWGLALQIFEAFVPALLNVNLSLDQILILALCETNLDDSVDSGNFSVTGYLPLIRKDSITHMHCHACPWKLMLTSSNIYFLIQGAM